jgi:hypothetical protein
MSSRNPDELRAELESIDFEGDPELLSELRSEARETVTSQKAILDDIDTKASKILRLNVLLIGVIISALSITTGGGANATLPEASSFTNIYLKLGIGSLILSTMLAAITYTASELDIGVSSANLTNLVRTDFTAEEAKELLLKNYISRINFNRSTSIRNTPLITCTIFLLVSGIALLALGMYDTVVGPVPWWLSSTTLLLLVGIIWTSNLIAQLRLAIRDVLKWR